MQLNFLTGRRVNLFRALFRAFGFSKISKFHLFELKEQEKINKENQRRVINLLERLLRSQVQLALIFSSSFQAYELFKSRKRLLFVRTKRKRRRIRTFQLYFLFKFLQATTAKENIMLEHSVSEDGIGKLSSASFHR